MWERSKLLGFLVLLFALFATNNILADEFPAQYRVITNLNVRSNPSTKSSKIGLLQKNQYITVEYAVGMYPDQWGAIDYGSQRGFVSMHYVEYICSLPQDAEQDSYKNSVQYRESSGVMSFLESVWSVIKWILIILVALLVWALWEFIVELAIYAALFAGVGAAIFAICGGNASTGANVGLVVAALVGLRMLIGRLDFDLSGFEGSSFLRGLFLLGYYIVSFPFYFLNRLEHFLVSPWRYLFMRNWASDSIKPALRVVTEIITIVMYIVTTPLRLTNAIIYNIFIHCVTGVYDLFLEVLAPSDDKEGGADIWTWIYMLPYRVLYYALWHVFLLLVESVIWTVVDIFIPARTFYHGTTLNAGAAITSDPHRNKYLKDTSKWSSGTFLASSDPNCSWAGRGVYFAIRRGLALAYSGDNRSGRGGDPVMIACRVSMGRVISYALMPDFVYNQAGGGGWHDEINKFADAHKYTAGEWYNTRGVWEYCLFDWQNRYNHPWRIRPIYMINMRTGLAQHICGGMQHWLFDKAVMEDLFEDF